MVGRSYEAVGQWYHRLAHLFEPEPDHHATVAVDETKFNVEDDEVYVWAAVDVDTFEVVHIEVSPGRSDLDALLFLKTVLKRCRGQPVIVVYRGPWYNWALDDLDLCESRRETWGERSLVEACSACSNTEPGSSIAGSPTMPPGNKSTAGPKPSPRSTMPSASLDTLIRLLIQLDSDTSLPLKPVRVQRDSTYRRVPRVRRG